MKSHGLILWAFMLFILLVVLVLIGVVVSINCHCTKNEWNILQNFSILRTIPVYACVTTWHYSFTVPLLRSLSDRRVEFGGCEADRGCGGEDLCSSEDSQWMCTWCLPSVCLLNWVEFCWASTTSRITRNTWRLPSWARLTKVMNFLVIYNQNQLAFSLKQIFFSADFTACAVV